MIKTLYTPFETFVFRTPLFPFDTVSTGTGMQSDVFKEAIFLASPELYEGNDSKNPKKHEKLRLSLVKYYQRAATRCTPFGLFAGCGVGLLGENTGIELEPIGQCGRCTRLDMQYLCALIQKIEQIPEVQGQLIYYPNDSIGEVGGKYRYIEYHYIKSKREHNVVSLEIDEALVRLLSLAAGGATISELAGALTDNQITREEAEAYVHEVIDSQVLKSELDPAVVGPGVLETLIEKISRFDMPPLLGLLQEIKGLLDEINTRQIGTTLPLYGQIIDCVKKLGVGYEAKFLFQTDLFRPAVSARIATRITDRLSGLIGFLQKISVPGEYPALSNFMRAFQNRYEDSEVPLCQVLDNELGLGYPVSSNENGDISPLVNDLVLGGRRSYVSEITQTPADRILFQKYIDSVRTGAQVVELTDEDFKEFSFTHQLPNTVAVMCSILDDEQLFVRSVGGSSGGNLLGRFCHLDKAIAGLVEEVAAFEQQAHPHAIVAEISHLPESRIGNIASRPAFRDYTLHYLSNCTHTERDIPVTDLMLSVREGRLFLRSKKYDKEVVPHLTCAHNYSASNIPVYRFLCDLQHQGKTGGLQCVWSRPVADMEFLPRIQYKGLILSRRRWMVKPAEVEGFEKLSGAELTEGFKALMQSRSIPRRVVIPEYDNELYLDLNEENCQRLFLAEIAKRKGAVLEEFLFDPATAVVHRGGDKYTNEVIFVFHK